MIKIALPNGKFIQVKEAAITPREAREYEELAKLSLPLSMSAVGGVSGALLAKRGIKNILRSAGLGGLAGLALGTFYAPIHTRFALGKGGREALKEHKVKGALKSAPKWMKELPG